MTGVSRSHGETAEALTRINDLISQKVAQLKHYAANDCQLDHARTIAEGRILQAVQIQVWIDDAIRTCSEKT